jgi:hypothetical protein
VERQSYEYEISGFGREEKGGGVVLRVRPWALLSKRRWRWSDMWCGSTASIL